MLDAGCWMLDAGQEHRTIAPKGHGSPQITQMDTDSIADRRALVVGVWIDDGLLALRRTMDPQRRWGRKDAAKHRNAWVGASFFVAIRRPRRDTWPADCV